MLSGALLIDAGIRADTIGIEQARQRLEALASEAQGMADARHAAQVHYYLGFARLQLLNNTYRRREDAVGLADDALAHFKQAIARQPDLPDAYALAIMTTWTLFRLAPERAPTLGPDLGQLMQQAQALDTDAPSLALIDGLNKAFDPNGPARPEGIARLEEAVTLFEQQQARQPTYPDWWSVGAHAWIGQVYLAMAPPAVDKARAAFARALALRPDYQLVKARLLPMIEPVTPLPSGRLAGLPWRRLATDAEGDGRNPALADGQALHYYYDAGTDSLWFKFDLHSLPDPDAFGINLAVDTDRNQETGMAWWGGNTAFTFDRVVTLWVTRLTPGRYRGTIGIAGANAARRGHFTNLARNNIAFAVDAPQQTLIVGFKRTDLGPVEAINVLGAVGSNLVWNDDLTDTGYGEVTLTR
jgi:tetratricopeptide (TPR) repeat protein